MAGKVPLAIGTCGTMGSLLKMEIEYFKGLELECVESRRQSEGNNKEMASRKCNSCPGFRFLTGSWKKKKRRSSGIQPGNCSMVEVADLDLQELNGIPVEIICVEQAVADEKQLSKHLSRNGGILASTRRNADARARACRGYFYF